MKYLIFILFFSANLHAELITDKQLFDELEKMDVLLFENAFNNCNLDILDSIIHEDLEFYHDKSGVQGRVEFINTMKTNICSSSVNKPIRKLAVGSVKVFRMEIETSI